MTIMTAIAANWANGCGRTWGNKMPEMRSQIITCPLCVPVRLRCLGSHGSCTTVFFRVIPFPPLLLSHPPPPTSHFSTPRAITTAFALFFGRLQGNPVARKYHEFLEPHHPSSRHHHGATKATHKLTARPCMVCRALPDHLLHVDTPTAPSPAETNPLGKLWCHRTQRFLPRYIPTTPM